VQLGEIDSEEHADEAGRERANERASVESPTVTHALSLSFALERARPGVSAGHIYTSSLGIN
jgi:hypothetical protein